MRRLLQQISPTINVKQLDRDFSVNESVEAAATGCQSSNRNTNCVPCNDTVSAGKLSGISKSLHCSYCALHMHAEMAQNSNEILSSNELS